MTTRANGDAFDEGPDASCSDRERDEPGFYLYDPYDDDDDDPYDYEHDEDLDDYDAPWDDPDWYQDYDEQYAPDRIIRGGWVTLAVYPACVRWRWPRVDVGRKWDTWLLELAFGRVEVTIWKPRNPFESGDDMKIPF